MRKSLKQIMDEVAFNAVAQAIDAIKKNNVDNGIIRDCKMIHSNTNLSDLPDYTKQAIQRASADGLTKLSSEGFKIQRND